MKQLRRVLSWISPRTPRVLLTGSDAARRDWFLGFYCADNEFPTGGITARAVQTFEPDVEYCGVIMFISSDLSAAREHWAELQRLNLTSTVPVLIVCSLSTLSHADIIKRELNVHESDVHGQCVRFVAIHHKVEMVPVEAFLWFSEQVRQNRNKL